MKFKVGQCVQIPENIHGDKETAKIIKIDTRPNDPFPYLLRLSNGCDIWFMESELVACQSSARVI